MFSFFFAGHVFVKVTTLGGNALTTQCSEKVIAMLNAAPNGILAWSQEMPGLDCIAMGPIQLDNHTSRERMEIASVKRCWDYLLEVLKAL